jgi:HlyD family secretion protein
VKIILTIVITLAVCAGVLGLMSLRQNKSAGGDAGTAVRVEPVSRGDLIEVVSAPGQVQPRTKVQISARVAARIIDLPYDEGQKVQKGKSILVKLDATDLEAQLRASEARAAGQKAQLAEAQARILAEEAQNQASKVMLIDAQRDLKRQQELLRTRDVSQSVVDAAQAKSEQLAKQLEASQRQVDADRLNLDVLKHGIEAADADVAQARDNLNYTTILSPIDGIITRLNAKEGEMVVTGTMNNPGTVIMEISDLSQMQVDAQVDENNIAQGHEGQKARIRISAYPEESFDGTVTLVGLDVAQEQQSRSGGNQQAGKWYRARIVLDTKGRRIPAGLSADVDIATDDHRNVIKVPTQSVLGRPLDELPERVKSLPEVDKNKTITTVVYRVIDGKAVITPVSIGASDMTQTEITSGLKTGDQIIVGPYKVLPTMADGQKVKAESATTKPATTKPATTAPATTAPATTRSDAH